MNEPKNTICIENGAGMMVIQPEIPDGSISPYTSHVSATNDMSFSWAHDMAPTLLVASDS